MNSDSVLLGMSGGVDSSYAAVLLNRGDCYTEGAVLVMSEHTDVAAAEAAAEAAGVKLNVLDCRERFRETVVRGLIDEYSRGRTPNPCVLCNREVKIETLCEYARERGFAGVATGHWAGKGFGDGRFFIERSKDTKKDQSYVLWRLTQEQLAPLFFPLDGLGKAELRSRARELGLPSAEAAESQEICFIPDKDYAGFIERTAGAFPEGDFLDASGRVVGRHRGIIRYTVGQRKGLGLALGRPVFVTAIDPVGNTVSVDFAGGEFRSSLRMSGLNFQALPPQTSGSVRCEVKIRYAASPVPAEVTFDGGAAEAVFDAPVRAVTPGQSAVCYDGPRLLFGGTID